MSLVENADLESGRVNQPSDKASRSILSIVSGIIRSAAFVPGMLCVIGITVIFWPLLKSLPSIWSASDGYYSHGFLIPFISGYVIYKRWDDLKLLPITSGWLALIILIPLLMVMRAANQAQISFALSVGFIICLLASTWLVAGWRWMLGVLPSVLYLVFALPVWTMAIDNSTNPLQIISTKAAFAMLRAIGRNGIQTDPTTLILPSGYALNVAVPCSGLKLLLAVSAFTIFFTLIAKLGWLKNSLMFLIIFPLCLLINGLRIALIGLVGDSRGAEAAHQFHDYSGYITLVICFVILFQIARRLGWKD